MEVIMKMAEFEGLSVVSFDDNAIIVKGKQRSICEMWIKLTKMNLFVRIDCKIAATIRITASSSWWWEPEYSGLNDGKRPIDFSFKSGTNHREGHYLQTDWQDEVGREMRCSWRKRYASLVRNFGDFDHNIRSLSLSPSEMIVEAEITWK